MKSAKNILHVSRSIFLVAALVLGLGGVCTHVAQARSLYVIGSITNFGNPLPIMAYDIAPDGSLTFQRQQTIPFRDGGAVGIAVDWQSEYLFVTFEYSDTISLLDARTLAEVGKVSAANAENLAGVVYDQSKELLYCVDRDTNKLFSYQWQPSAGKLLALTDTPFTLEGASAFGIALDEERGLLYAANGNPTVTVYDTTTWSLRETITLKQSAISVAVDPARQLLYTGAGYYADYTLNQYDLTTGQSKSVQVDPEAGVMGLAVDLASGLVYATTGKSNLPGGDDLLVYDTSLTLVDSILNIGDPTGIVIPAIELGYNPLNFRKQIIGSNGVAVTEDAFVAAGDFLTYRLCFDNANTVRDVTVVDTLPQYVTFVDADGLGDFGSYNASDHTCTWTFPQIYAGSSTCLTLLVKVNAQVPAGTLLRNYANISTREMAATTVSADATVFSGALQPLGLTKEIIDGAGEPDASGKRYVDIGQEITYRICFDNRSNSSTVSNVTVVDILPPELAFVSADGDRDIGSYDPSTHTYTWNVASLASGATRCLELVAVVRDTASPGATIVNQVTIDSEQTAAAQATAEVTVQPVDASPLGVLKRIAVGTIPGPDDRNLYVGIGEVITYEICLDSRDDGTRLEQLMIVDTLPREVSFVSAEGDGIFGAYDLDTHTYTWVYPSLLPGSGVCLSLVVQVGRDITPGTTISNTVTVENRDVAAQTASVSAIAETREILPVDLVKTVTAGIKGQDQSGQYVVPGQSVTYTICASNNTDVLLGNVTIIDNLPPEVTFDSADGDDDIGRYDPATHSYTWSFPQIDAGATICANITVIVNKNVGPGTSIVNEAQLETGDTFVSTIAELFTESDSSPTTVPLSLSPLIIAREGFNRSEELTATLAFSAGVEPSDIPSEPVVLSPGSLVAKTQTVSLENGILKIRAKFDLHRVLNAIPEDGLTTLTVSGQLRSGRTFVGTGNILVVAVRPY